MAPALTRRQTLAVALVVATVAGAPPHAALAQQTPNIPEMTMGDPNAAVTLVEYAMFTCPHCAAFMKDVFPQIKQSYIDTGKVKLVFREVYFNKPSLWAAMIARCAPEDRYFGISDLLFSTQSAWVTITDEQEMLKKLYSVGRQAGMSDAEMDKCMQDRGFAEALVAAYQQHQTQDNITGTPTFILNGETMVGETSWKDFQTKIDALLAK